MIKLNYRRQCALAETGDGANGELAVRCGERQFTFIAAFTQVIFAEPQIQTEFAQQVAGTPGVACCPPADRDNMVSLRV